MASLRIPGDIVEHVVLRSGKPATHPDPMDQAMARVCQAAGEALGDVQGEGVTVHVLVMVEVKAREARMQPV